MNINTEQPETVPSDSAFKYLTDLNLKQVAADFGEILTKHLGGEFDVTTSHFLMLKGAENPLEDGKFKIEFVAKDKSNIHRPAWQRIGLGRK
jgi:hypothetical protein